MPELLLFPSATRPVPAVTSRVSAPLSDAEAREAALDIQRSWIVEAPAGSGKTGLLIQRYLCLLAHAEISNPDEVLVLTFTRKADGELRTRVLEQLTAALERHPLPPDAKAFEHETRAFADAVLLRDRARGWRLLETPSQLNIRTIDSFCAELAGSMPLLSNNGRLKPIDDAFPLYAEAAERTVKQFGGPDQALNQALRTLILLRDAQVSDCLRLVSDMLAQREQWSELIPLNNPDLTDQLLEERVRPRLERTLRRIVENGLARAVDALGLDNVAELNHFAARLSTEPGYKDQPNPLSCFAGSAASLSTNPDQLAYWKAAVCLLLTSSDDWRKKPNGHHLSIEAQRLDLQALEQFIQTLKHCEHTTHPSLRQTLAGLKELPPATFPDEQWDVVKALCRVLSHALVDLRAVFSERGHCDFTEVALTARSLLCPDPADTSQQMLDPSHTFAGRLNHLLVDEMQDTSTGQYQLLEALTESWDGASQTVFLVGDPKQSIYAFRQARVERFLRTMEAGRLGELALHPIRLSANFRSQAALVDEFNSTFSQVFPSPKSPATGDLSYSDDTAAVPFVAATPVRSATTSPALHWHAYRKATMPTADSPTIAESRQEQARDLRRIIEDFLGRWSNREKALDGRNRPPKIAVLGRNRSHLAPIIAEFHTDHGQGRLAFRAVDVEPLHERMEVRDLVALTRALLDPADRVAWLAVLRSPVCGLGLADLLALTGEGDELDPGATVSHLVSTRQHFLAADGQQRLQACWPTLQYAADTRGATPLSTHLERTWRSLGMDAPLRPDQRTNALRYLDLLRKLESGTEPLTIPLLTRSLQRLYAEPGLAETPVELMTIHKAKGLEWDLVLIPAMDQGSGRTSHGLLKWLELDNPQTEGDLLLAPIAGKGTAASELSRWLSTGERRREAAEAQRLFYVACTRAREELHLFATVETRADGSLRTPQAAASLLYAAWPAAKPILQTLLDRTTVTSAVLSFTPTDPAQPLALAASAGPDLNPDPKLLTFPKALHEPPRRPTVRRLPESFRPLNRFQQQTAPNLPYPPANALRRSATFARPAGSFTARAFGNCLHRVLQLLSTRLAAGQDLAGLQTEVALWQPRLTALLRNEGLPQSVAAGQAERAVTALQSTLTHPEGAWVLGPRREARNEANLLITERRLMGPLRADRTFFAGATPLSEAEATQMWIIDYKTTQLGGRDMDEFLAKEKQIYRPQLQAYAEAALSEGISRENIRLALYFPLLPALIWWPADLT